MVSVEGFGKYTSRSSHGAVREFFQPVMFLASLIAIWGHGRSLPGVDSDNSISSTDSRGLDSGSKETRRREIYERYYRSVHIFFLNVGFSRAEARDLAQETFVRVYRGKETFRGEGAWSFVQRTARRIAIDEIQKDRKLRLRADLPPLGESVAQAVAKDPATVPQSFSLEEKLVSLQDESRRQEILLLQQAFERIRPKVRHSLLLRLQGYSYREIAMILRVQIATVRSGLYEIRHLQEQLERRAGTTNEEE